MTNKELGQILRYYRKKRKWTQNKLSKFSGKNRNYISDFERGKRNVTIDTVDALFKPLGLKLKIVYEKNK